MIKVKEGGSKYVNSSLAGKWRRVSTMIRRQIHPLVLKNARGRFLNGMIEREPLEVHIYIMLKSSYPTRSYPPGFWHPAPSGGPSPYLSNSLDHVPKHT